MSRREVGYVDSLYSSPSAGASMEEQEKVAVITGLGIAGDRYAEGNGAYSKSKRETIRHISLTALEAIQAANEENNTNFTPEDTRRNIITKGAELEKLIGIEFLIGNVVLRGVEICTPCNRPSNLSGKPGFLNAFRNERGGIRAEVLSGGIIHYWDGIVIPD